jgi:hypothetical protein
MEDYWTRKWDYVRLGCGAVLFGSYISMFGTQPDAYIFMVKGLVFWDATKCGFVEKYGCFEYGSFGLRYSGIRCRLVL